MKRCPATVPGPQVFPGVMERTIQLVGDAIPGCALRKIAEVLRTVRWEFPDYGFHLYLTVNDLGEVRSVGDWSGPVDSTISMDAATLHNAAYGKTSFGAALLLGKLRVRGVSASNLGRLTSLLHPFLDSYRQACSEVHGPGQ